MAIVLCTMLTNKKMAQKLYKKWTSYRVEVSQEFSEKLKNFIPASV